MGSATVSVEPLVEIYAKAEQMGGWCYLRFQERTGFVSIASDFGHWTFHWPPYYRPDSLGHFLSCVDEGYAGRKFLGADYQHICNEATARAAKNTILRERREGYFGKLEAREEWDLAEEISSGERDLDSWVWVSEIKDAYELIEYAADGSWLAFWERVWEPHLRPALAAWPRSKDEALAYERGLCSKAGEGAQ
ncbi:MAG: hypothetical protein AAGM22_22845 [Acidobacteriota bacterium]